MRGEGWLKDELKDGPKDFFKRGLCHCLHPLSQPFLGGRVELEIAGVGVGVGAGEEDGGRML